jgi:hypothetical protein
MVRNFFARRWPYGNKPEDQTAGRQGLSDPPNADASDGSITEGDNNLNAAPGFPNSFDEDCVQLIAPTRFELCQNRGSLTLPAIRLYVPSHQEPLQDIRLQIKVEGGPEKLSDYVQAAYDGGVTELKKSVSQTVDIIPRTTAAWDSQIGFDQSQTAKLTLTLTYRTSAHSSRPLDPQQTLTCIVELYPHGSLQSEFTTNVHPSLIRVFCGRLTGPALEIMVRSRQSGSVQSTGDKCPQISARSPDLKERSQDWKLPRLVSRVEQMLKKICTHFVSDNAGGWYTKQVPQLEFELHELEQLQRLVANGTLLRFTIRISVAGSPATEFSMQLLPDCNPFPGVVSIDLGTAGSTVVVNDPAIIDCPAVPVEQVQRLKSELLKWLKRPVERPFPNVSESQWYELLASVAAAMNLQQDDIHSELERIVESAHLGQNGEDRMFELLRQIELAVFRLPIRNRRHIQSSLFRLMSQVFEEFPLRMWHVRVLDFRDGSRTVYQTSSELELADLYPEPIGTIGYETAQRHELWLRSGESDDAVPPRGSIRSGRFIRNPKSSLEHAHQRAKDQYSVTLADGSVRQLSPRDVTYASFGSLLETFEESRSRLGISPGPLNRVVVTYPASLLPEPREAMVETLKQLGIRHVDKTFDEAVAPAIFYIEQRFSDAPEIGPEAFKTRCRRIGDVWYHQMLIIDVGAGTTDIALVQIEMRETRSSAEPKNGGRIYTISPRLLGSTGRQHLGGNLITLLLFRRLKLELAEWLVRMKSSEALYDQRSPFEGMDLLRDDPALHAALDAAEQVIPTRFQENEQDDQYPPSGKKAQTSSRFFAIWEIAETLKLEFSRVLADPARPSSLELEHLIRPRLQQIVAGTEFERLPEDRLMSFPMFPIDTFSALAGTVIEQISKLAVALTSEAIRRINSSKTDHTRCEDAFAVDSIVLSGRSCQLPLFREQIEAAVQSGPPFSRNRTEVLYHEKYAKLATAIGALRGQRLVSLALTEPTSEELASGQSSRDLDIRNLFFFLPSSFKLGTQNGGFGQTLFEMHEQFRHHDFTNIGCLRTDWKVAPNDETLIYRTEGENLNASGRLWGQLLLKDLADPLRLDIAKLRDGMQIRYEVTHELDLFALLWRRQSPDAQLLYSARDASTPPGLLFVVPANTWKHLLRNELQTKTLPFPIYVGEPRNRDAVPLIPAGMPFHATCTTGFGESPTMNPALWSELPLPPIAVREKVYDLYTKDPQTGKTIHLAHFDLEVLTSNRNTAFSFESSYRLLVALDGTLALFCGDEPPFWSTTDPDIWIKNEGQVLRHKLPRHQPADDLWRDPFCGRH